MTEHPECVREWVEALEYAADDLAFAAKEAASFGASGIRQGECAASLRSLRDMLMQGQEAWQDNAERSTIMFYRPPSAPVSWRPVLVLPIKGRT